MPGTLEHVRQKRAEATRRQVRTAGRIAAFAVPLLLLAGGAIGYRYWMITGMMADIARIADEADACSARTRDLVAELRASGAVDLPEDAAATFARTLDLWRAFRDVATHLSPEDRAAGAKTLPDGLTFGRMIFGRGQAAEMLPFAELCAELLEGDVAVVRDRLRVCRDYVADSMLGGELIMLPGAARLIEECKHCGVGPRVIGRIGHGAPSL